MPYALDAQKTDAFEPAKNARRLVLASFLMVSTAYAVFPGPAGAQSYQFDSFAIEGNTRIEDATVLSYAGIARGQTVSAAEVNEAYQRILGTGLFESVEIEPKGSRLVIKVAEFPTVNRISFEGNRRINDEILQQIVQSKPRRVFSANVTEDDAAKIAEAYNEAGRISARVTPRIIRRSDNRVDLVFEIFEGALTEVERIGFVGNKAYSDRRLRGVLATKQAGLLRTLIQRDTLVEDRVEFDKQVLSDFYQSRGYVDFRVLGVNAELARERDGYFMNFNIYEGQQFSFGKITTSSELNTVDAAEFQAVLKLSPGTVYSPALVDSSIARLERLALQKGLNFVRVEPRITRNDRDFTLDIDFALIRGERIFVERIDIEGNTTTQDQVIRRQFRLVEGDPFNPREIRESAERIRALNFFEDVSVDAREGARPDLVVVEVDVEEKPTGSLSLGGAYATSGGFSLVTSFTESNFLGRGQSLSLNFSGATASKVYAINFKEPAFLGRDLSFGLDLAYDETDNNFANYDSTITRIRPSLGFPTSDRGRINVYYAAQRLEMTEDYSLFSELNSLVPNRIVRAESNQGGLWSSLVGYNYKFDSSLRSLDPNTKNMFEFGQEFSGLGGDTKYLRTKAKAMTETKVWGEEVTLSASVEGGLLQFKNQNSRSIDRFQIGTNIMRGFAPDGIGPRENSIGRNPAGTIAANDSLGGNIYAVAKLEAEFPLGLPEEYGMSGGVFYDIGSLWGIDYDYGSTFVEYSGQNWRQVVGFSLFWDTVLGPLRFNFTKALQKQAMDEEQTFEITVSTKF
ncbi:MAG: outer membrane protein assembly factor BamA [Rhodobacteraceae bacterium]|nr:outer membrane protein assembly factor BamA [Paracoccaceae bacterium]